MAADLYIHVAKGITEEDLKCFHSHTLGTKWFNLRGGCSEEPFCEHSSRVTDTPSFHVGEVSWLKGALTEDWDKYVPSAVEVIHEAIGEELPILDDELRTKIEQAFKLQNQTSYQLFPEGLSTFLDIYMGERLFTVSW